MLRIEQTYLINAAPEEVWAALTDPTLQAQWSGQRAQFDARVGGTYQLFDDYVTGEIVEADAPNKLAQTWQPDDWTITDSVVSFVLTPVEGGTQVVLVHENVQPEDFEGTSQGWDDFYVGAIKKMLEAPKPTAKPKAKPKAKPNAKVAKKAKPAKKAAVKKKPVVKNKTTAKRAVKPASKKKVTTKTKTSKK